MDQDFIAWAIRQLGKDASHTKAAYGDQSTVYRLESVDGIYFLKIAKDSSIEKKKLEWAYGKLPVPKVLGFAAIGEESALLLSAISGETLKDLAKVWPVEKIIDKLVMALRRFHETDTSDCPFGAPGPGKVLVHGDFCLPNIFFDGEELSGYIDLGEMRIDVPDIDLAAAVSTLEYNFGRGHELAFLTKYGVPHPTEELVESLLLQYAEQQKEWGL